MSRRAWFTLFGLFALSLVVAFLLTWGVNVLGKSAGMMRPGFGLPWPDRGFAPDSRFSFHRPFFLTRFSPFWVVGRVLASEVFLFLVGMLGLMFFPQRLQTLFGVLSRPGKGMSLFGFGFLAGLLMFLLFILAVFSFIGLIFLPVMGLLMMLAGAFGLLGVTWRVGVAVRDLFGIADREPVLEMALGTLTIFTLGSIPFLGWLALFFLGVWGVGAAIATRLGTYEVQAEQIEA